ncbi:hypothetical protein HYV71_04665 [Candidatus Uhrbacteria bacterium]|nr:hypothetical protein [Candidatus Uhrbacteria bacterium]
MASQQTPTERERRMHIVYGAMFSVIALAALVAVVKTYLDANNTVSQTASVTNATPSITVNLSDNAASTTSNYSDASTTVTLTENSGKSVYVHGTATDTNGCDDITKANATWDLVVYRTNLAATSTCSADNANCYKDASESTLTTSGCTAGGSDTGLNYEFGPISLQFYADATDASTYSGTNWTAYVTVDDANSSGSVASSTDTFEVASTNALDASGQTLAYGSVALGALSSEQSITVSNTGNRQIDATVSSTDFSCANDTSIDLATVDALGATTTSRAASTTLTDYGKVRNSGSEITLDTSLAQQSSNTSSTDTLYFRFEAPSSGAGGACTATVTLTSSAE